VAEVFFFWGECEFFEHANFVDLRGGVKGWVGESLQGEIAAQKILVFLALYTVGCLKLAWGLILDIDLCLCCTNCWLHVGIGLHRRCPDHQLMYMCILC
jgi:hypothetical protein